MRSDTRRDRYRKKLGSAIKLPVYFAAINFDNDENVAFLIRTAACYGVDKIFIIGSVPSRSALKSKSGSLTDFVDLVGMPNPSYFLKHCRDNNFNIVSAEITNESYSLFDYKFSLESDTVIVLGHETVGVPSEILYNSDVVSVPMLGAGYCLNTSQTGTAFITEYARQFLNDNAG